ncbi:MAG: hypothetical protein RI937_1629 [Pseudomonadota bacterium]
MHHFWRASVDRQLKPMTIRIKEINRLENRVIGWAHHLDTITLKPLLDGQQGLQCLDFQRQVLHPIGCIHVARHFGAIGELEKRQNITAAGI